MRQQRYGRNPSLMQIAAAVVGSAAAAQVVDPAVAGQASEHTYETALPVGVHEMGPDRLDVVGLNGRRLIAIWTPEGLYIGGCLVASAEDAEALARFITREADE